MRGRYLGALLVLLSVGLAASAQTPTADQLQALKDSLPSDQLDTLLQSVLGKGSASGKKVDQKLKTPETVQPPSSDVLDAGKARRSTDVHCAGSARTRSCAPTIQ